MYEVNYYLQPADVKKVMRTAYRNSRLLWLIPVLLIMLYGLPYLLDFTKGKPVIFNWSSLVPFAIILPFYLWGLWRIGAREVAQFRKNGFFELTSVQLDRDCVRLILHDSIHTHKWSGAKSITSDQDFIHFNLSGGGGFFIPQRAFASKSDAEEFIAAALQFHQNAS